MQKFLTFSMLTLLAVSPLAGCERNKGTLEETGENAKQGLEDAGQNAERGAKDAGDRVRDGAEK